MLKINLLQMAIIVELMVFMLLIVGLKSMEKITI